MHCSDEKEERKRLKKLWIQDCRMALVLNIPGVISANDYLSQIGNQWQMKVNFATS